MAALGTTALLAACGGGGGGADGASGPITGAAPPAQASTIAQAVAENPDLSALRAAVQYVDEDSDEKLMPQLAAAGDKTLFAPNNAAFDKLAVDMIGPGSKAADLLAPEYKDDLRDVLKTNMMPGRMVQSSLRDAGNLAVDLSPNLISSSSSAISVSSSGSATASVTIGSGTSSVTVTTTTGPVTNTGALNAFSFFISIKIVNGVITITDGQGRVATLRLADFLTGNGVIHIIDNVLMPPKPMLGKSIVAFAQKTPELSSLVAALKFASNDDDLVKLLSKRGTFTVFAPTNDAFAKLPAGTVDTLLKPENKSQLVDILTYHVVSGRYKTSDLTDGLTLKTVEGKTLTVKRLGNQIWINGSAMISTPDVISSNGVTHVVDSVLIPK